MDSKTALRGPNASAGPFTRSTADVSRLRVRSAKPDSLTSSINQYGLSCTQKTKTYHWTSQVGLYHQHPRHPDHNQVHVQEPVAERPGLHFFPDHEYLSAPRQRRDQERCDRVARSTLPQSLCLRVLVLAVLSGRGLRHSAQEAVDLQSSCPELRSRNPLCGWYLIK